MVTLPMYKKHSNNDGKPWKNPLESLQHQKQQPRAQVQGPKEVQKKKHGHFQPWMTHTKFKKKNTTL